MLHMKKKMMKTSTLIKILLTVLIYHIFYSNLVIFREVHWSQYYQPHETHHHLLLLRSFREEENVLKNLLSNKGEPSISNMDVHSTNQIQNPKKNRLFFWQDYTTASEEDSISSTISSCLSTGTLSSTNLKNSIKDNILARYPSIYISFTFISQLIHMKPTHVVVSIYI